MWVLVIYFNFIFFIEQLSDKIILTCYKSGIESISLVFLLLNR